MTISFSSSSIVAIFSIGRLTREMKCGGITSVTTLIFGTLVIADSKTDGRCWKLETTGVYELLERGGNEM